MKLNKSLIIGSLILFVILIVAIAPSLFTDVNPYGVQTLKYSVVEEGGVKSELKKAPFEPSPSALLGTDEIGRDIYSFIIYGTRLTLKIALWVSMLRFLIAIPLGIFAGFGNSVSKTVIRQFNILLSGLPSLLFAILVLSLSFFTGLDKKYSSIAFIIVLTFVGWSKLAQTIEELSSRTLKKPFITSEYALGKSRFEVAVENVIPHLMPEIVVLFFMEMARSLTMIIQLGIFAIFIGNLRLIEGTDRGIIRYKNISFEPEWASLLGSSRAYIRAAPWMIISPAVAFFISVLGFNMFGEGLRIKLQDKNSMFVPKVRKILVVIFINSHRKVFIRSLFSKRSKYLKYSVVFAFVLVVISGYILINNNKNLNESMNYFTENDLPEKLLIGMEDIEDVTNKLSSSMQELGLLPLYDNYKKYYDIDPMFFARESSFSINDNYYKQDLDYIVYGHGDYDLENISLVDLSLISLYELDDLSKYKNTVILIDEKYYNEDAIEYFVEVFSKSEIKGILIKGMDQIKTSVGKKTFGVPVIILRGHNELKEGDKVSINYKSEVLLEEGVNVVGILPGNDEKIKEECIVIGLPLNYMDQNDGLNTYNYALNTIEKMVKKGSGRTVIFAFFDGNYTNKYHGLLDYTKKMVFAPLKTIMYLDVMNLDYEDGNRILIDKEQAPETRYFGISFLQVFNRSRNNVEVEYMKIQTPTDLIEYSENPHLIMYHRKGITTLLMDVKSSPKIFFEALFDTLVNNN